MLQKMAGNTEDVTLSMVDVLEEDRALEEEANAVLGASDAQNCTYPQGYVGRQALYSCLTCCPEEESLAGVCFACSLHCHDGHDLIELYTKRNFRCDCGNSKFNGIRCKLFTEKSSENVSNIYNQNFRGRYCTCRRPYPDPDDEIEDEMIQCVICEDWYHSRHLGSLAPVDYMEMICDACMQKSDFLRWYKYVSVSSQDQSSGKHVFGEADDSNRDCTVDAQLGISSTRKSDRGKEVNEKPKELLEMGNLEEKPEVVPKEEPSAREGKSAVSSPENTSAEIKQNAESSTAHCKLHDLKNGNRDFDNKAPPRASFWPNHWRKVLCKCTDCKVLYQSRGVPFIVNNEDTVSAYEEKGKRQHESSTAYDEGMRAFNTMNRINQVEVLTEYNDMKSQLHDFLRNFAGEGKVVTKEDIEEFFAGMKAKKRRRLDGDASLQYHCR